jgi:hypothetical protein
VKTDAVIENSPVAGQTTHIRGNKAPLRRSNMDIADVAQRARLWQPGRVSSSRLNCHYCPPLFIEGNRKDLKGEQNSENENIRRGPVS